MQQTTVINFYGGPGIGKSTSAAAAFAYLKRRGFNAELVREYVKKWAWEDRPVAPLDQIYLLGKQAHEEARLYGRAEVVVTDSPVLLGVQYARKFAPVLAGGVERLALDYYRQARLDGHRHWHVLLTRGKPYVQAGRWQTEAEALELDTSIRDMLLELEVPFVTCGPAEDELRDTLEWMLVSKPA